MKKYRTGFLLSTISLHLLRAFAYGKYLKKLIRELMEKSTFGHQWIFMQWKNLQV